MRKGIYWNNHHHMPAVQALAGFRAASRNPRFPHATTRP
jgi:hypothetical protein